MAPVPNQVYTAFSFLGFVLCAVPFYWHLEAWNTGTCMYMAWTGLGCLFQCVNSIVWNKNTIDRAPVYCDIVTHFQTGLNVAIPLCSLCMNRRLYKIATISVRITRSEKRRAVIIDLLICIGLPLVQMATQYVVANHRYNIFEDFGPSFSTMRVPQAYYLVHAWPVAIGCVSLVYCVRTIYAFYKRSTQLKQFMSSHRNLNRGRYLRLMVLSSVEIFATIPLGTFVIVHNAKHGVSPWISWEHVYRDYSRVIQVPASVWKEEPFTSLGIEFFRWVLVASSLIFFAFFGFADEARQHYRLVYTSLASRVGIPTTTSTTLHGSSHATSLPHMKSKGGITVPVVTTGDKRNSAVSISDQLSIPSISIANDYKSGFKITEFSPSDSMASSSVPVDTSSSDSKPHTAERTGDPSTSVAHDLPDTSISVPRPYTSNAADTV